MTDHLVLRVVAVAMFIIGSFPLSPSSKAAGQEPPPSEAAGEETPPAAEGEPAPTEGTEPAGAPTQAPATAGAVKSQCEARIARLVGNDSAALRDPGVRDLAKSAPSLAVCAAVARDSDEPCDLLPADQAKACRKTRLTYHALRDPKSRAYIFTDAEYRDCKASPEYASVCDAIYNATRSGDPDQCPSTQPFGAVCRASITLNPALCPADDADCKKDVERWKAYANGVQALKASGSAEQRALAAAALGEADACKPIAKPVLDSCSAGAATAPAATGATAPRATTPTAPPRAGEPRGTR